MLLAVGLVFSGLVCALAQDMPRRCCLDNQFSVRLGLVGEVLGDDPNNAFFIDGYARWGYDYYTDRFGTITHFKMPDGTMASRYELKDYSTRRIYNSMNNSTCTYKPMEDWDVLRPICIPESANYLGPSTMGYGHNSIKLHTWSYQYQLSANSTSQIVMSVTEKHCVPVSETIIGAIDGIPVEESLFFTGYHPGIEHLNYLDAPSDCVADTN